MGVVLSRRGVGVYRDLADKGVREEAAGNNRGLCSGDTDIRTFHRRIEDEGFQ